MQPSRREGPVGSCMGAFADLLEPGEFTIGAHMNTKDDVETRPGESGRFAPAEFAARAHPFRALAFVSGMYLAVVASAPWLILDGPPVTPTPQVVATAYAHS